MTQPHRTRARTLLVGLVLVASALAGCGEDEPERSTDSPASPTTARSADDAAAGDTQVVEVEEHGLSFELPHGWTSLNGRDFVEDDYPRDVAEELAGRLGMSTDQLIQAMSSSVLTLSMSDQPPRDGFTDNVNTVAQTGSVDDEQLVASLQALGAEPGEISHVDTAVGDVARVPYDLPSGGTLVHGVSLNVAADGDTVTITVSSASAEDSARIADQVQDSLAPLRG